MRAVVQRITNGRVEVGGEIVGAIGHGLLVYLGVGRGDTEDDLRYCIGKVVNLRIFENAAGKMDKSVIDVGGALLVISQFTLYGDVRKGRRPSFDGAMPPGEAEAMYERFVAAAREFVPVETGRFRADMKVTSTNDGPITILIDSSEALTPRSSSPLES